MVGSYQMVRHRGWSVADEAGALRSQLACAISAVEGWTSFEEVWALHEAARCSAPAARNFIVVEIGSWKGRSTVALALGLKARGNGTLYAIDPHTGSHEYIEIYGAVDTYETFIANLKSAGVLDLVEPIRSTSHSARDRFTDSSVHLLFVDGSHEYADVITDIHDWTPALADESVVAFNDPLVPGVYRALRGGVLRFGSPFRAPNHIVNTLFFEFRRRAPWTLRDTATLLELRGLLALRLRASRWRRFIPSWAIRSALSAYDRLIGDNARPRLRGGDQS